MHLRLIDGFGPDEDEFPFVAGIPAADRPCRPGFALTSIQVSLDPPTANRIEMLAASAGVTASLWSVTAVEANRALDAIAEALDFDMAEIVTALDLVAMPASEPSFSARNSELTDYATGLRNAAPRPQRPCMRRTSISLTIPTHTLLAWTQVAEDAGDSVGSWAAQMLSDADAAPIAWEAAAAGAGLSIGEWISIQAARAASRRSSAAQTLPCG